jgi:hypothetical protein
MSVSSHLDYLGSNLILTSIEDVNISKSIDNLNYKLNAHFSNIEAKSIFGSYDRNTILPRSVDENSDIDYLVIFKDASEYSPQTCLNWLRKFAEDRYSRSEVFQSSPTIVLELNHIKFELVPAYRQYGTIYIPASASSYVSWIITDPGKMKTDLVSKNTSCNSKIKPLIRILKYWNVLNERVYTSYELENMIVSKFFFNDISLKDYFFDFVLSISTYGLPHYKTDKVERLKNAINEVKKDEEKYPYLAESNLVKELPSI